MSCGKWARDGYFLTGSFWPVAVRPERWLEDIYEIRPGSVLSVIEEVEDEGGLGQ